MVADACISASYYDRLMDRYKFARKKLENMGRDGDEPFQQGRVYPWQGRTWKGVEIRYGIA